MTYIILFLLGAFIGWAFGSGNHKAIWAWLVAALGSAYVYLDQFTEFMKGVF